MGVNINDKKIEDRSIKHIAFIMDGNGRWAKKRGMPREYGHKVGAKTFEKVLERCGDHGIEAVTFYVFSTENWKRSQREIDSLMKLLGEYLDECEKQLLKNENDMRFVFLGDKTPFSKSLRAKMERMENLSRNNKRIVNLAINYGGRSELVHAFGILAAEGKKSVSEEDITRALYTKDSPELDLIVRTGGDFRISNFLLWQAAYSEFYFTDKLWPDITADDIDEIIEDFKHRQRRFGGV